MNGVVSNVLKFKVLSLVSLSGAYVAYADLKPTYAIYPVACAEKVLNRSTTQRYCLNSVAGSNLEVFSSSKVSRTAQPVTQYYLVTSSYDLDRRSSDEQAQVIVPAKRVKKLEPLEVDVSSRYPKLKAVAFTVSDEIGEHGITVDERKEITLTDPTEEMKKISESNVGLILSTSKNFSSDESFEGLELKAQAVTRGL